MSIQVEFGNEIMHFEFVDGYTTVTMIANMIREEKNVTQGVISRCGNITMRISKFKDGEQYKFINYEIPTTTQGKQSYHVMFVLYKSVCILLL
jgi:hypothetical protein